MSEKRMAGDALRDANFEARSRLSNDPEEAAKRAGLVGDNYDVSGYSDKEISMALMGSSFGDEDYARLTGKSMSEDAKEDSPEAPAAPSPSPEPSPEKPSNGLIPGPSPIIPLPGYGKPGGGSMLQNVIQDNDVTNTINGDNNQVDNYQDNSVSQSGGYASRYARGLKDSYLKTLMNR